MIDPDVFSFAALWRHYRRCRRNKRNTANALAFELDAEARLLALQGELRARTYSPGRSVCFITDGPKPREVFAADFRDRIVHHLLVAHQDRVFEPMFIHDSYNCRDGALDGATHRPRAVAAQPVRSPAPPRRRGQPLVLRSRPLHRVLRPATPARRAGTWPAANPAAAGVLRVHGGISALAV